MLQDFNNNIYILTWYKSELIQLYRNDTVKKHTELSLSEELRDLRSQKVPKHYKTTSQDTFLILIQYVTGASVHAPRQSNSRYVQTVRQYIYKTRGPEHPYSPIRQCKQRPQGTSSWPRCMESFPETALLYAAATSTSTSTVCRDPCEQCTAAPISHPLLHQIRGVKRKIKNLSIPQFG